MIERVEALPGVRSAAVTTVLPVNYGAPSRYIAIEGRPPPVDGRDRWVQTVPVTPRYFETVGMRVLQGRSFSAQDRDGTPGVAVITESMAREYWRDGNPIGQRVRQFSKAGSSTGVEDERTYEVVGIVNDTKTTLEREGAPTMYIPMDQQAKRYLDLGGGYTSIALTLYLTVRTTAAPGTVAPAVRHALKEVDPTQPVDQVATLDQVISRQVSRRNFALVLLGLFAGVALVLSAVGIYGVMAYAVAQRTHEIGVRLALGATRRDVRVLVTRQGMRLALLGVAFGLAAAMATTHFLQSLLFEITATDPLTALGVTFLLTGMAFLACYIPARRATKVDPMVALRCE